MVDPSAPAAPQGSPSSASQDERFELGEQDLAEPPKILLAGRYELLGLVGSGAYGAVYRTHDHVFDEVVALKILRREHLAREGALERFREEVRIARRIAHPNVVRTYTLDEHEGERLLSMEFVDGQRLTEFCRLGSTPAELLPYSVVVDTALQLCSALQAIHDARIVHCDLKPDNVLVTAAGRLVLTDFGIARLLCGGRVHMAPEDMSGTPVYMAPEQVCGGGQIDIAADLYAFGVILFQLLTGSVPFLRESAMATALARLGEDPPSPATLRHALPTALSSLTLHCLARDPGQRPRSAGQIVDVLSALKLPGPTLPTHLDLRRCGALGPGRHALDGSLCDLGTMPLSALHDTQTEAAANDTAGCFAQTMQQPANRAWTPAPAPRIRIAVLLFRSANAAPVDPYLVHGLTQTVIECLSDLQGLSVKSYGAVLTVADSGLLPCEIGQRLGVQAVVWGQLSGVADGLHATVRAIEVEGAVQFAARRFGRADRNVLALGRDIAAELSKLLTSELSPDVELLADDPVAADLYLQARYHYNQLHLAGARKAKDLLVQALARQPRSPRLLTAYALTLARFWALGSDVVGDQVVAAAEQAYLSAPHKGEPLLAMAASQLQSNDGAAAGRTLRQALCRIPRASEVHELSGRLLAECGPLSAALRHTQHALSLDESSLRCVGDLSREYGLLGDWDQARQITRKIVADAPHVPLRWSIYARIAMWRRDVVHAQAALANPILQGDAFSMSRHCMLYVVGQFQVPPEQLMPTGWLSPQTSPRSRLFHYQRLVELYLLKGDRAQALAMLQRAVEQGLSDLMWTEHCPLLRDLDPYVDFVALLAPVRQRAGAIRDALGVRSDGE